MADNVDAALVFDIITVVALAFAAGVDLAAYRHRPRPAR